MAITDNLDVYFPFDTNSYTQMDNKNGLSIRIPLDIVSYMDANPPVAGVVSGRVGIPSRRLVQSGSAGPNENDLDYLRISQYPYNRSYMVTEDSNWSMSIWVKLNSEEYQSIIGVWGNSNSTFDTYNWRMYFRFGRFYFQSRTSYGEFNLASSKLIDFNNGVSDWVHVVCTYNSTTKIAKIYVTDNEDGITNSDSVTRTNSAISGITYASTQLRLGGLNDSVYSNINFVGYTNQMAFWNKEVSSSEVSDLYNNGDGLVIVSETSYNLTQNQVAHWTLDEATGTTRVDSVNSYDLLDTSAQVAQVSGKINNAASFTGVDCLSITGANAEPDIALDDNDSFSCSAFIRFRDPALYSQGSPDLNVGMRQMIAGRWLTDNQSAFSSDSSSYYDTSYGSMDGGGGHKDSWVLWSFHNQTGFNVRFQVNMNPQSSSPSMMRLASYGLSWEYDKWYFISVCGYSVTIGDISYPEIHMRVSYYDTFTGSHVTHHYCAGSSLYSFDDVSTTLIHENTATDVDFTIGGSDNFNQLAQSPNVTLWRHVGYIDSASFWKRRFTTDNHNTLYNSGDGLDPLGNDSMTLFIEGIAAFGGNGDSSGGGENITLFIEGGNVKKTTLYIPGQYSAKSTPLYVYGVGTENKSTNLFTHGKLALNHNTTLYTTATGIKTNNTPLYIKARQYIDYNDNINLFMVAIGSGLSGGMVKHAPLFLQVGETFSQKNNNIKLYIMAPVEGTANNAMPLYLLSPAFSVSGNIPLFIPNFYDTNDLELFVRGDGPLTGSDGYVPKNNNMVLYIKSPGDAGYMTLYMKTVDEEKNDSINLYMFGAYIENENMTLSIPNVHEIKNNNTKLVISGY